MNLTYFIIIITFNVLLPKKPPWGILVLSFLYTFGLCSLGALVYVFFHCFSSIWVVKHPFPLLAHERPHTSQDISQRFEDVAQYDCTHQLLA